MLPFAVHGVFAQAGMTGMSTPACPGNSSLPATTLFDPNLSLLFLSRNLSLSGLLCLQVNISL